LQPPPFLSPSRKGLKHAGRSSGLGLKTPEPSHLSAVAFRGNFYAHHGCWDSGGISPLFPVACMFENFKV